MDINEIIKVETLPKIYQQLEELSVQIDDTVKIALDMPCNESSKTEVKKARANINKIKTELEDRRKVVKEQILEPYYKFEDVYNSLIKEKLFYADDVLKSRINEIENTQKAQKEEELKFYFKEYCTSLHLENLITWEQLKIKINLSDSDKKLREQVKTKLDNIAKDIEIIKLEGENADEILAEYLKSFDFAMAKLIVANRIQEKRAVQEHILNKEQYEHIENEIAKAVEDEITIPVETVDNAVENLTMEFRVIGTKEQLVALKQFMIQNDIKFENI